MISPDSVIVLVTLLCVLVNVEDPAFFTSVKPSTCDPFVVYMLTSCCLISSVCFFWILTICVYQPYHCIGLYHYQRLLSLG